jgi:hypothetical protein
MFYVSRKQQCLSTIETGKEDHTGKGTILMDLQSYCHQGHRMSDHGVGYQT